MNLCIDQGNSSTKVGIFDQLVMVSNYSYISFGKNEISKLFTNYNIDSCILSSVIAENSVLISELNLKITNFIELSHSTLLPIENRYETPQSLGKDRLAAVVGANFLMPNADLLVIDAGTAITYDFIDSKNVYLGGNIAAGYAMRLRALHEFTQKLPLVPEKLESQLLGNDTQSALVSGALHGIVFEIDGYINVLKIKYPQLSTFLTGGSTFYFNTKLKNAIFAEKNLVLIGLNRILQYNVQK